MLDDLLSVALIGTARGKVAPPDPTPALRELIESIGSDSSEQRLLTHIALRTAYDRSGLSPSPAESATNLADKDERPACSARAAALLEQLLIDDADEIIAEWLAAAAAARQRVPHRLLPGLMHLARKHKSLRQQLVAVVDQRGRWLMEQNPDWQFAVAETLEESAWESALPEQRLVLLRRVRATDPAHARDLLQTTWKDDPADQRTRFVEALREGLSPDDEPWLESLLDDRSKQVSTAAADLLARLPESQLVRRMIDRLTPLLSFKRGLLKGLKLDVTLPDELDKAIARDGIQKTINPNFGQKQGWLLQMLGSVPLTFWTETAHASASEILAAVAKTEYAEVLVAGFSAAAERYPQPQWLEALLRYGFEKGGRLEWRLLSQLSQAHFLKLAQELLRSKPASLDLCADLLNCGSVTFDEPTARLWIKTVAELSSSAPSDRWRVATELTRRCGTRFPPVVSEQIREQWNLDDGSWQYRRKEVEKMLNQLEIRGQIQKEFAS